MGTANLFSVTIIPYHLLLTWLMYYFSTLDETSQWHIAKTSAAYLISPIFFLLLTTPAFTSSKFSLSLDKESAWNIPYNQMCKRQNSLPKLNKREFEFHSILSQRVWSKNTVVPLLKTNARILVPKKWINIMHHTFRCHFTFCFVNRSKESVKLDWKIFWTNLVTSAVVA